MSKLVHCSQLTVNRNSSSVNWRSLRPAFTLIEVLVVITIIALLIGFGTLSWINGQQKAHDGRRKQDLKEVQNALELYVHVNGQYPAWTSGLITCGDGTTKSWGSSFDCSGTTYMQKLPTDPMGSTQYYYYAVLDSTGTKITGYVIWSTLENTKNPDYCSGIITCVRRLGQAEPSCLNPPNSTLYSYCGYLTNQSNFHFFVYNP